MMSPFKFQQFLNLGMNQGFKKALTTVRDYPAMIMLPAFSVWTYGSIEKGSCHNCQSSQKIGLSYTNSCLNVLYTLCVAIAATIMNVSVLGYEKLSLGLGNLTFSAEYARIIYLILLIPVTVVSIILMSVVACMDTCSCCSCSCCCDCLLTIPMTERTAFGHQEEEPTEIALVETNPPASPKYETTAPLKTTDTTTIKIQDEATETTTQV